MGVGGGIVITLASPTISYCVISDNSAAKSGGIHIADGDPSIDHCIISGNDADDDTGGGIGCRSGAPLISNCLFYGNSAQTYGGGICCSDASPTVRNCTFSDNTAHSQGGGISAEGSDAFVEITNTIFEDCRTAVYTHDSGHVALLENCLFYNNSGGAYCDDPLGCYDDSEIEDLNNDFAWATGNITGDPLFVDKSGGDFHIQVCSAAVDQGAAVPLTDDLDGNLRPVDIPDVLPDGTGTEYDIGAYETQPCSQAISVDPLSLEFGAQHPDEGPTSPRTVTIENLGGAVLQFTSITLSGSSDFQFASPPDTSDLDPCESRDVQIVFDPSSVGEITGGLLIESNDPANPIVTVPLSGVGSNVAPVAGLWQVGAALAFDGTDDYVNCGSDSVLMPTAAITVEAWIYADAWKTNIGEGVVVGKDQHYPDPVAGYMLRAGKNGKAQFTVLLHGDGWTGWMPATSGEVMQTGQWHHIAGVYDGDNIKIFIDGVERDSGGDGGAYPGIVPSDIDLWIAASPGWPANKFEGQIDDVRVWSHARTEPDIQADMNHELHGDESGLVGYWRLDEGSGSTTEDATANGNNGVLVGDPQWVAPPAGLNSTDELTAVTNEATDLVVTLEGFDVDGDPLQAIVTALPTAGQLYQYDGGVPGALIDSVPTVVIDPERRVIYVPETGAPYDAVFQWQVNDGYDDSANTATMTVSVCVAQVGDIDADCDVDLHDFELFAECMTGPDVAPPTACDAADIDDDGDVDTADFAEFQRNFTGSQP